MMYLLLLPDEATNSKCHTAYEHITTLFLILNHRKNPKCVKIL